MTKHTTVHTTTETNSPTIGTLSQRQVGILRFVHRFDEQYGYAPTVREIGWALEIPSTSMVNYYLSDLARQGYVHRTPRASRSIRLLEAGYRAIGQPMPDELQTEIVRLRSENRRLREQCEQLQRERDQLLAQAAAPMVVLPAP